MALDTAHRGVAVTPNDSTNLTTGATTGGLWIGVGGTISYVSFDPAAVGGVGAVQSTTVTGGTRFPVQVVRVNATGTTASGIIAFY